MSKTPNRDNILEQFILLKKQIILDIDFSNNSNERTKNMFRLKSIEKVIKQFEKYDKEILDSNELKDIDGIGKGTLLRIDEILKTGKLKEVKITGKYEQYLNFIGELEEVFGIGRKKAYELFKEHNIKTIEELKDKVKNKEIDLPENIIKGLYYVDKIKLNIPRETIKKLNDILLLNLLKIDDKLEGIVCGSYRREKKTSNDIDFIITHPELKTQNDISNSNLKYLELFVKKLKENKIIETSLTSDSVKTKYMGICNFDNIMIRIDIRYIPFESYHYAMLYFTGSKDFNTKMRNVAISMNYKLNEYGLYDENKIKIDANSEKDIFDILGMEYLPPNKR